MRWLDEGAANKDNCTSAPEAARAPVLFRKSRRVIFISIDSAWSSRFIIIDSHPPRYTLNGIRSGLGLIFLADVTHQAKVIFIIGRAGPIVNEIYFYKTEERDPRGGTCS
jgi:hypothetical protein